MFTYGYGYAGNLTSETDGALKVHSFEYDALYRLRRETHPDFPGAFDEILYSYDPNGNRRTRTVGGLTEFYNVDAADKLWWVNQGVDAPPVTTPVPQSAPYTLFDYDANGRMEARERKYGATLTRTLAFQWDSDDRLRKVMDGATTRLDAGYSGDGLRVTKTENWPGLPGAPLSHTYSWGPGGVVHDTAGGGNGTVYTPGLAQRVNTTETFFHSDWLGSTRYLRGSTGATLSIPLDPWGEPFLWGSPQSDGCALLTTKSAQEPVLNAP